MKEIKESDRIYDFLEKKIYTGEWLNDNHCNYEFLDFCDKFCKGKTFEQSKKKFHYHMKKFVQMGMCRKEISYLSAYDIANVGRRTMINYIPLITRKSKP